MKLSQMVAGLAGIAAGVNAAPAKFVERQLFNANGTSATAVGDVNVLNFALILEYLELNLYETVASAYSRQDFINAGFDGSARDTFVQLIAQEKQHIAGLQRNVRMLGGTVIQPCRYNYGNATSLNSLLNVTDAVNALGPAAYVGAGAFITSKLVLTEGASIGNVESRHNSWLNGLLGRSEQPNTYQTSLSPTQAYGVGSQFIVNGSCPAGNAALQGAILAYPPGLNITNPGYPAAPLSPGGTLNLAAPGVSAPRAAFLYGQNTTIVAFTSTSNGTGTAKIPLDATGAVFVVLTTASAGQGIDYANSLTAPQAFYVDAPVQGYALVNVTAYDFLP